MKTVLRKSPTLGTPCETHELVMFDEPYQTQESDLILSYAKPSEGVLLYDLRFYRNASE